MRTNPRLTMSALLLGGLLLASCDGQVEPTAVPPEAGPRLSQLQTAADSAAAREQIESSFQTLSVASLGIRTGDKIKVTVSSANTGRCESVAVTGVIEATLFTQVGTCNGVPYSYGVGQTTTAGPATSDGTISFILPLAANGTGASRISGSYPTYTVELDDAMYDFDYNDVVLTVTVESGPPNLSCTPQSVSRGQDVDCIVTGSISIADWQFKGGGTRISRASGSRSWKGPAVIGGEVTVKGTLPSGKDTTMTASFAVTAREWQWSKADWHYEKGEAPIVVGWDLIPSKETNYMIGWNCTLPDCKRGWIIPDLNQGDRSGYDVAPAADGPNTGLWYVTRADFYIRRGSNLNPSMQPDSDTRLSLSGSLAQDCQGSLGIPAGSPVVANWFEVNTCKERPAAALLEAAWLHEGYGSKGTNGHQSQGEMAAAEPRNDPRRLVEGLYRKKEADLHRVVQREFKGAEARIDRKASKEPTGNFPATTMYVWSYKKNNYTTDRIRSF